jgi:hypothetical protein
MNPYPQLNLDSDGVLLDFERLGRAILGMDTKLFEKTYGSKRFWGELRDYRQNGKGFFECLELMSDAMVLFNAVKHTKPHILTGAPGGTWAPEQKLRRAAVLFPRTKVIVCLSRDKIRHIEKPGDFLVDDTLTHRHLWEDGGGVFIHHTSARESIAALQEQCPIFFQHTDRWTPPAEYRV